MNVRTILAALAFGIVATTAPAQTLDLSPEQPGLSAPMRRIPRPSSGRSPISPNSWRTAWA
jgi:hypothetical protein